MKICLLMAALCGMAVLTGSTKYETTKPAYEEKPMKMEYKKEEPKTPEYKTEPKMEYTKKPETKMEYGKKPEYKTEGKMEKEEKKTDYPTKMEYTTKKKMYKRSVADDETKKEDDTKKEVAEDQIAEDPRIRKEIKIIRRILIKRIMSDPLIRYALITYPATLRRGYCWDGKDSNQDEVARSVDPDLTAESDNIDEDMDEMHESPPGSGRPMRPPVHPHRPARPSWMRRPMVCRRICY